MSDGPHRVLEGDHAGVDDLQLGAAHIQPAGVEIGLGRRDPGLQVDQPAFDVAGEPSAGVSPAETAGLSTSSIRSAFPTSFSSEVIK